MRTALVSCTKDDVRRHKEKESLAVMMRNCPVCSDPKKRIWIDEELVSEEILTNPYGDDDPPYLIVLKFKCERGDSYEGDGDCRETAARYLKYKNCSGKMIIPTVVAYVIEDFKTI